MAKAVFSDVHGNLAALDAVLSDIKRRGITEMINLGDSLSGPFDAAGTADRLIALDIPTVQGNHDRQLIDRPKSQMGNWESWVIDDLSRDHLDWLRAMPLTVVVDDIFVCHATPTKDDENWLDRRGENLRLIARDLAGIEDRAGVRRYPLMLCGHTHQPRVVQLPDGTIIANPGSVGCPAYRDTRTEPHFVHQTGSPDASYAILDKQNGRWRVDLVSVAYDPAEMIRLAQAKGADHWAQAISTGWLA